MSPSPYLIFSRDEWKNLRGDTTLTLEPPEIAALQGLSTEMSINEVVDIFLPLSRFLSLHVQAARELHRAQSVFLGREDTVAPYLIGMAGSVSVGKSTTARVLRALLSRWPGNPRVELVTTDGFLHPNETLRARGLMQRKGFPESYRRGALLKFVSELKAGAHEVRCPVYSHLSYDIIPGEERVIQRPDIVIIEGLNVLQTSHKPNFRWVADFFDFSIYLDAGIPLLREWYVERFLALRDTAFQDPASYFHNFADLTDEQAVAHALRIWQSINEVNLQYNILPTRERAGLIMVKGRDHRVQQLRLRRR
ncbi:MAG: type I pantothenate kinase [Myxococcota bacterium]